MPRSIVKANLSLCIKIKHQAIKIVCGSGTTSCILNLHQQLNGHLHALAWA